MILYRTGTVKLRLFHLLPPNEIMNQYLERASCYPNQNQQQILFSLCYLLANFQWHLLYTNFLNHSVSLIHISQSLPHSLTSLVMSDHRFHQRHHCHRLSPLLSFTPDSKHTFSTNHFHHSLPIIDQPWTDFTVTQPAQCFFRLSALIKLDTAGFWARYVNFTF